MKICVCHLAPVLDTLLYIAQETDVWLELTTLLIPGENDDPREIESMTQWIVENLGTDVPLHFTAFHPDWKMRDKPSTPKSTLTRARDIAIEAGMKYVYTGNVHDCEGSSTYCPGCGAMIIERDWYELGGWNLRVDQSGACCLDCGTAIAGVFEPEPGTWGSRRQPLVAL